MSAHDRRSVSAHDRSAHGGGSVSAQGAARDLTMRVAALLAAGVMPEAAGRARRAAGVASPADLVEELERRHGPPLPATVDPRLHVLAGDPPLPDRLAATWDHGGPLWVWRQGPQDWPRPAASVAIVGTRHPTLDGLAVAEDLAAGLAAAGVEVVSGMARGIDQAAHAGALSVGGRTTAVLGTGLDVDYPAGSADLRARVAASGGLVSEYPDDRGIRHRAQFLARNRILAGLADVCVVVEAGARSGALNTASWAADFGRDVAVVPASPSTPSAAGALALLRDGAVPVRDADDVLELLGVDPEVGGHVGPGARRAAGPGGPGQDGVSAHGDAGTVWALLGPVPASVSQLARGTGLGAREVLVAVAALEQAGLASHTGAGVVRARPP